MWGGDPNVFARSVCSALGFGKQAAGLLVSRLNDSLESQFKLSFNSELARWCAGVVEVCSGRAAELRGLKSLVYKAHDTQWLTR